MITMEKVRTFPLLFSLQVRSHANSACSFGCVGCYFSQHDVWSGRLVTGKRSVRGGSVCSRSAKSETAANSIAARHTGFRCQAFSDRSRSENEINGLHPVKVAVVNEHESEKRIFAALGDETTNAFVETPLEEAIEMISRNHNIPIVVDKRALEEIGLTPDTPVNLSLKNVTLRSFLRLMLRELDLTYMIKDQVMQITTVEAAEQNLGTQMYRLPDNLVEKSGQVLTALQSAIVPDTWSTQGGPSSATTIDHVLIISTTSDVHDQVDRLPQYVDRNVRGVASIKRRPKPAPNTTWSRYRVLVNSL